MGWQLQDVEERNRKHPRSFFIPPAEERRSLRSGQLVKLVFLVDDHAGHEGERMWVIVDRLVHPSSYVGRLDNDPVVVTGLKAGDHVQFGPQHIASIWSAEPTAFPAEKKAFANRQIVEEDIQPQVLIYEVPKSSADSGWTLLIGSESREEMNDPSLFIAPNLGWIVERYPAMLPTINAALTGVHVWDERQGNYRFDGEPAF